MPPNPLQPEPSLFDDHEEGNSLGSQSQSSSTHSHLHSSHYGNGVHFHHLTDTGHSTIATPTTIPKNHVPSRAKEVDDLLSKELYQLTFADRNAISEEIHGVRCLAPEETPELISGGLMELQRQLDMMPYKPSYDKAQAFARHPETAKTSYVNTIDFRLKFLRCELFDASRAAVRLIKYLDLMVEMYGLFALQRKILLTDFSKHELQIMRAGFFQLFPFRDRSGRRVMCIVGNMGAQYDPFIRVSFVLPRAAELVFQDVFLLSFICLIFEMINDFSFDTNQNTMHQQLKTYFYFWMSAAEDVESQRKGVVFLVWPGANSSVRNIPSQKDRLLHMQCNNAAPIRITAVHFCFPNEPFFHFLRSIMTMTLGITYRLRLKFHVGKFMV